MRPSTGCQLFKCCSAKLQRSKVLWVWEVGVYFVLFVQSYRRLPPSRVIALDMLQSMYSSVFSPVGRPTIEEDPEGWWIALDQQTLERYNPQNPLPFHPHRDQPRDFYDELCNEDFILEVVSARRVTASSQLDHSRLFVRFLVDEDFEQDWTTLSPEDQEKHFLAAFAAVEKSFDYATFLASKADCPELNRATLFTDRGLGFIELMRQCVLSDNNEVPSQPRILVDARFDRIIGYVDNDPWQSRAALNAMARMTRSSYIGMLFRIPVLVYSLFH